MRPTPLPIASLLNASSSALVNAPLFHYFAFAGVVEDVSTVTLLAEISERNTSAFEYRAVAGDGARMTGVEQHEHPAIFG
jgi:hypothetical protein